MIRFEGCIFLLIFIPMATYLFWDMGFFDDPRVIPAILIGVIMFVGLGWLMEQPWMR